MYQHVEKVYEGFKYPGLGPMLVVLSDDCITR